MSPNQPALFDAFPGLESRFPRYTILPGPTPVERFRRLERQLKAAPDGTTLWVKRDDRSAGGLGGNKARKLEFILGQIRAGGYHTVVTPGMIGSNHALGVAQGASLLGIRAKLDLGPQPVTDDVRKKLLAFHALGAEIRFHRSLPGLGLRIACQQVRRTLGLGSRTLYLPAGGSSAVGTLGYVNAFFELCAGTDEDGLPDEIVLPVGSGGTVAGLLAGACLTGRLGRVRFRAVSVTAPLLQGRRRIVRQARDVYRLIRSMLSPGERAGLPEDPGAAMHSALTYVTRYREPGYGAAPISVHRTIETVQRLEGLLLDATYSGKAMHYLMDRDPEPEHPPGPKRVLFWLTYPSIDLEAMIRAHAWTDPERKWLDLPRTLHALWPGKGT